MKNALAIEPASVPMPRGKKDAENRGELNSINIEMTENGCIVRCSFDPEKIDPKLSRYDQMPEDEKMSFDDCEKAAEYVKGLMASAMDDEATEDGAGKKKAKGAKKADAAEAE